MATVPTTQELLDDVNIGIGKLTRGALRYTTADGRLFEREELDALKAWRTQLMQEIEGASGNFNGRVIATF